MPRPAMAIFFGALFFLACENAVTTVHTNTTAQSDERLPYLTFKEASFFPGDSSLSRPEDGAALADGRVIVVDQARGLRIIEKDGTHRPFGNFAAAGFVHNPPDTIAGPNGVFLEHDGQHLLVCDIGDGKIYRVNIPSEKVEVIYDHPFGVNAAYRDKTGAIWFTQSGTNTRMYGPGMQANIPEPNGAVYRLLSVNSKAIKIADSLHLPNGITMDREEQTLFVAETMMNRVLSFRVDSASGAARPSEVAATVIAPDNIFFDSNGILFIASPGSNKVVAVDFKNHSQQVVFDASTNESRKIADEWFRRSQLGLARGELISTAMYAPLPHLLTGMFFSADGRTLFVTNLGNDIVKVKFK